MGSVRLLLAMSVMIVHGGGLGGIRLVTAEIAVNLFFIASGYIISAALERDYLGQPGGRWRFWANRALRIYPVYLVCLVAAAAASGRPIHTSLPMDLVEVGILGSILLSTLDPAAYGIGQHIIPPAWSLDIELTFYLLAPWLAVRLRSVPALAVATALAAAAYWGVIAPHAPELLAVGDVVFFLLGMLSYRAARALDGRRLDHAGRLLLIGAAAWCGLSILLLGYPFPFVPGGDFLSPWWAPVYAGFAAAVPLVVRASQRWRWDGWLGDLSYPLYVCHTPAIIISGAFLPAGWRGLACLGGAVLLWAAVDRPMVQVRRWMRGLGAAPRLAARPAV